MTFGLLVGCAWALIFGLLAVAAVVTRRKALCYWQAPVTAFTALLSLSSLAVVPILLLRDHFEHWADAYLISALAWFGAMHALGLAFRRRLLLPDSTAATTLGYLFGNVAVITSYAVANAHSDSNLLYGGNLGVPARSFWACIALFGIAQLAVLQRYLAVLRSDMQRSDRRRLAGYQIGNGAGIATLAYGLGVAVSGSTGSGNHHVALILIIAVAFGVQLVVAVRPAAVKVRSDQFGRGRGLRSIKVPVQIHGS